MTDPVPSKDQTQAVDSSQLCVHPWARVCISAEGTFVCNACNVNLRKDPPWRDVEPSKELRLGEWQPLARAYDHIVERLMLNDPDFVLQNWDCKYIDARIDMRTGNVLLTAGNRPAHEREPPHCANCSCGMEPEQLEGACPNCNQWVVLKRAAQPPGAE